VVTTGQNEEALKVSSYAHNVLGNFAMMQRKFNIKGKDYDKWNMRSL
jgi:hypothetical protein